MLIIFLLIFVPLTLKGLVCFCLGFYQYVHLIFGTKTYEPAQPTESTVKVAKQLFDVLRRRYTDKRQDDWLLQEARDVMSECNDLDSLLNVFNDDGFHIVQMCVLCEDRALLRLLIEEGCSLNKGKCTLPLHIACSLGHEAMVKFLLVKGADRNLELGMCYPHAHQPVRHVPSRFHFLETNIYRCDSNHQLPLMFAIENDNVGIVRVLLQGKHGADTYWPYHRKPLHHACKKGSFRVMQYLVDLKPSEVNDMDEEGKTPLLHATPWGKSYVKLLEEAGADVRIVSSRSQTALHVLYANILNPGTLYDSSLFLLGTGLEQDTSARDDDGNTALHVLISSVNRKVHTFSAVQHALTQQQWDALLLQSVELLLQHNCDANLFNDGGVTALHKLILLFDYITSNELSGLPMASLPSRNHFSVDFHVLHSVMRLLLRYGATANLASAAGRTPLIMLLQCVFNVDPRKMFEYHEGFLNCISLLCSQGAEPSSTLSVHLTMVTCLSKLGQKCLSLRDDDTKQHLATFLERTLAILFEHGLHSNYCSLIRKGRAEGASGNILFEIVKLAQYIRQPSDLDYIYSWALTALQWGADPDIEPFPSDPIIYQSHSSIYLKNKGTQPVNAFMYEIQDFRPLFDGGHAERLLTLFINSMDHVALYQGLNSAKVMSRYDPVRSPTYNFIQLVNNLSSQPRSLKQMSRVVIYKAINRQLKVKVPKLPLPKIIQNYLIDID